VLVNCGLSKLGVKKFSEKMVETRHIVSGIFDLYVTKKSNKTYAKFMTKRCQTLNAKDFICVLHVCSSHSDVN